MTSGLHQSIEVQANEYIILRKIFLNYMFTGTAMRVETSSIKMNYFHLLRYIRSFKLAYFHSAGFTLLWKKKNVANNHS